MPSENDLLEALRQVEDPELGMDVVDLGLVYEVAVEGPKVKILYSLTSMGCPAGPLIAGDMERVSREVPGVEDVELELTFDPPWTPDKMSEDAKFILGFGCASSEPSGSTPSNRGTAPIWSVGAVLSKV
jgi:metal-sulfur cluster biosynthetic enzyme